MKKIVVIGSINIDLFIKTSKIPKVGETLHGEDFNIFQGGKGANQAVAAARLGGSVSFIGAVGDDENGKLAIESLKNEGINTDNIKIIKGVPTGVANVISCEGDNSIIVIEGANKLVNKQYVESVEKVIAEADIILLQNEVPFDAVKEAIMIGRRLDKVVVYNPAPFKSESLEVSNLVTYCTPNEIESKDMSNSDNLIITLGEKGVKYKADIYPANKVSVVDTTGAGDTFNGALCASLAKGKTIEEAIKYGINASGLAIQRLGAQTGMPYESEIE